MKESSDTLSLQSEKGKNLLLIKLKKLNLSLSNVEVGNIYFTVISKANTCNNYAISYSTVVLFVRDHGDLGFPSQKIHPKTSFTTPSWNLGSIG